MKELSPELKQTRKAISNSELITYLKIVFHDENDVPIVLRFTDGPTTDWKNETWVNAPFVISGIQVNSSGEKNRPKLNLPNDLGAYTRYIQAGLLDGADVTRYKALPNDSGGSVTLKQLFYISRVIQLTSLVVTVELRRLSDGNKVKIPHERYISPEFPTVVF